MYTTSLPIPVLCHPPGTSLFTHSQMCQLITGAFLGNCEPLERTLKGCGWQGLGLPSSPSRGTPEPPRLLLLLLSHLLCPLGHSCPISSSLNEPWLLWIGCSRDTDVQQGLVPSMASPLLLVLCSSSSQRHSQGLKTDWDGEPWGCQK